MGNEEQAPKKEQEKGFLDKLWDGFASVKLAIVIFALIGLTSIVGTVLEQNAPVSNNIKILSEMFGQSVAVKIYPVLEAMGFVDMYHSWWFVALLMLFCINLLICSLDRLPRIWKLVSDSQKPLKDEQFKAFPIKREFAIKGNDDERDGAIRFLMRKMLLPASLTWGLLGICMVILFVWPIFVPTTFLVWSAVALLIIPIFLIELLSALKLSIRASEEDKDVQFLSQHGRFSRLGVYITHLSIIVIMIGALIGVFFGFNGFLNIGEGEIYPFAFARKPMSQALAQERNLIMDALEKSNGDIDQASVALGVDLGRFRERMNAVGIEPLGFVVECKDFEVDFYGLSDMPKEYRSQLAVYEDGKTVQDMWIEVNNPLRHRGYTFYQSSYGPISNPANYTFKFVTYKRLNPSARQEVNVRLGESFVLPDSDITVTVAEHSPALSFDQSGRPFTYDDMMNNPAVRLSITDGELKYNKWVLKRYPDTWSYKDSHIIQLVDIWGAQYTGLQVRKDPGVWVVYYGCSLIGLGLYMAFFMSHRRIWLKLSTTGAKSGGSTVMLAASANKNREGFERTVDKAISQIKDGGK